jgi:hypothetical protein
MNGDQISKTWRGTLINKLRERYGLTDEEAGQKADAWLKWIGEQHLPGNGSRKKLKSRTAERS